MDNQEKQRYEKLMIHSGVTAPKGYKAAGIACDIKQSGRKDMAIILSDMPASAAAVFTTNKVAAAPVLVSKGHVANGIAQAIVINSGNANACTGKQGLLDAKTMAGITAGALSIKPDDVIVSSTGIIGVPLPMQKVEQGITTAAKLVSEHGSSDAAEAIMTTDTFSKEFVVSFETGGGEVKIGGMAKGSGMIAPNMATMLAVITTDANVPADTLNTILKTAVDMSFNSITVDGDTSTNDMVVMLANGASGVTITDQNINLFQEALNELCIHLAKLIVRDGEGATKLIEVAVKGAANDSDAKKTAMAVANSNLVKTAFFGQDPNWGRIVCAVGYSSAQVDQTKVDVYYDGEKLVENGTPIAYNTFKVEELLKQPDVKVEIDLKLGAGSASVWTCDFSYDYVKINAEYHT
ncbi:MAG TPA: bifunctional glutamate N-acetyltransferase/amino-acid acetyltransferase ArgJ [Candidatus Aquicultor sp.]|jgi:glutamate N-acetyltransferase/amino-acid N-acetyltransferase